jgi:hypothetical protein
VCTGAAATAAGVSAVAAVGDAVLLTDEEKVKLLESMSAYAGTYTADGEKVVHHVDTSWNGSWTGTDQVRFYKLEGDTLTYCLERNNTILEEDGTPRKLDRPAEFASTEDSPELIVWKRSIPEGKDKKPEDKKP